MLYGTKHNNLFVVLEVAYELMIDVQWHAKK